MVERGYDHMPLDAEELADVRQWVAESFPTPMRGRPRNLRALVHRLLSTVDEREAASRAVTEGLDVERLARALDAAWDSPVYPPIEPVPADHGKQDGDVRRLSLGPVKAGREGWFQLRPTPGLPSRIAAEYARLSGAER